MSKQIIIRISVEQHDFVKSMDGNFAEIWRIGFEQWARDFPEFLQKKAKEYEKLYIQCIDKMQDCINNVYTKNKELDKIVKLYVESGRSIQNPTSQDKYWVKSRIKDMSSVTVERFFEYCNGKFNDGKQQMLGGVV